MNNRFSQIACATAVAFAGLALSAPAQAAGVPHPPTGTPASGFATQDQGCLGPLRSQIAQGVFAGFGPFGQHFTGAVNPGDHYGTVGEAAFLTNVLGVTDVTAFCSQFIRP